MTQNPEATEGKTSTHNCRFYLATQATDKIKSQNDKLGESIHYRGLSSLVCKELWPINKMAPMQAKVSTEHGMREKRS